jgi:hypothetical protein
LIICECDKKAHQLCLEALDALNMALASQGKVHALNLELFKIVGRNVPDEEIGMRDFQVLRTLFELARAKEMSAALVAAAESYSPDLENAVYQAAHCAHKRSRLGLSVRIGFVGGPSGEISEVADDFGGEVFETGPWRGFPLWENGLIGDPDPEQTAWVIEFLNRPRRF